MASEEDHLRQADDHLQRAERLIDRQRKLVAKLGDLGDRPAKRQAQSILESLLETAEAMKDHREMIRAQIERKSRRG